MQAEEPLLDDVAARESLQLKLRDVEPFAVVVALGDDAAQRRGLIVDEMNGDEELAVRVAELAGAEPHARSADVDALPRPSRSRAAAGIELREVEVGLEGEYTGRSSGTRIWRVTEARLVNRLDVSCMT